MDTIFFSCTLGNKKSKKSEDISLNFEVLRHFNPPHVIKAAAEVRYYSTEIVRPCLGNVIYFQTIHYLIKCQKNKWVILILYENTRQIYGYFNELPLQALVLQEIEHTFFFNHKIVLSPLKLRKTFKYIIVLKFRFFLV